MIGIFCSNAVMWIFFSKSLQLCSSVVATVTNTAANFFFTVRFLFIKPFKLVAVVFTSKYYICLTNSNSTNKEEMLTFKDFSHQNYW